MSEDDEDKSGFDRTELAEDRTIMAVERTFAGWMRTAFAAIGIGLAFKALFGELDPPWLARVIASLFMVLAAALSIGAERRACHSLARISSHSVKTPRIPSLRWISYGVALGALVLAVSIWMMNGSPIQLLNGEG